MFVKIEERSLKSKWQLQFNSCNLANLRECIGVNYEGRNRARILNFAFVLKWRPFKYLVAALYEDYVELPPLVTRLNKCEIFADIW